MNEYNDNIIDESKTILRIRLMPNELEDELEKNLKNVLFQKKKKKRVQLDPNFFFVPIIRSR